MTPQQRAVLDFIGEFWRKHRYGPTYTEIGEALKLRGKNGPHYAIQVLLKRGLLVKDACSNRTIRPSNTCPHCGNVDTSA